MRDTPKRVNMKPTTDAMRVWALAISREIETWPGVTLKSAFGMMLAYRKGVVFAALPRTRALYEEDAILVKFLRETPALKAGIDADERFAAGTMEQRNTRDGRRNPKGEGRRWRIFVMRQDSDLSAAIGWLGEAYEVAKIEKSRAKS